MPDVGTHVFIHWLMTSLATGLREIHISQLQSHRNWEVSWWNSDRRSGCFPGANTWQEAFPVSRERLETEKEMRNIWTERGRVVGGIFMLSMIPPCSPRPASFLVCLKTIASVCEQCPRRRSAATDLTVRQRQKVSRISLVPQTCINSCIVVVLAQALQLNKLLALFPRLNYYRCSPCLQVNEYNTFGEASSNVFVVLGFCTFLISS